jgi:GWxTD domain-containing protein
MTPRILTIFFCLFLFSAQAQVLRDINYNYRYNPNGPFNFNWKVVRLDNSYKVFYEILQSDTTQELKNLSIQFETRESLSEKDGVLISSQPPSKKAGMHIGSVDIPFEISQNIIVAKIAVSDQGKSKLFTFYKHLTKNKSSYLSSDSRAIINSFTIKNQPVTLEGFESNKPVYVSFYSSSFPAGAPPFSVEQGKVPRVLKPDSTFTLDTATVLKFTKKGLYLVQQDTTSSEGIAFESLVGPLLYICTKQETEKLKAVGNDKKKFDQLILGITGNAERARTFMRNYFKRVEFANLYFSSYKEGWKTDRGLAYIIFGLPEEVYLFEDREVWEYKNDNIKIRLQFVKSPTLFDPDNYVLIRDKKFTNPWYEMVGLWRKARF